MAPCRLATAAPHEEYVDGACAPGWDRTAAPTVEDWIAVVRDREIEWVCCLLSDRQLADYDGLLDRYRSAFGPDRVAHVPIDDHTLAAPRTLREGILPVLEAAVDAEQRVVVHCLAGLGRTGQALAAWLVSARGYDPGAAISTVADRHRRPTDAVEAGDGSRSELIALLASVRPDGD